MAERSTDDNEYLTQTYGSSWHQIQGGNDTDVIGLVMEKHPLPSGYQVTHTKLMILIPNGYPGKKLEKFYCVPPLQKSNGSPIEGTELETRYGETWQCWNRPYEWLPGIDTIISHLEFVKNELKTEAER